MWAAVQAPGAPLLTQRPADAPGTAVGDAWCLGPCTHGEVWRKFPAPGSQLRIHPAPAIAAVSGVKHQMEDLTQSLSLPETLPFK